MNTAGLAMLEANSLDQVKGLCVYPLVAEENREAFMALTRDVFKGRSGTLEFKMTGMKGRPLWLYTHAVPLRNEAGEIVSALAVTTDVTKQKLAEEALRESVEQFRSLAEHSITGICIIQDNVFVYVNPRLAEILGFRPEELIGRSPIGLVAEHDREMVGENLRMRFSGEASSAHYTFTALTKTGEQKEMEVHGSLILLKGRPAVMATLLDITEQRRAEEALRESEARFRRVFEDSPIGMAITSPDMRFQKVNSRFCEIMGYTEQELRDMTFKDITHPDDAGASVLNVQRLLDGESDHFQQEKRYIRKDGTTLWARLSLRLLRDRDGRPLYFLPLVEDITERRLLEEERLKTQKLESVGMLAGGIAHDFNNLLQGIFGYISMARMTIDRKEKALTMLEQAEKALHHSVNLTTQLLTFSKGGKPVKQTIALAPVIENAARFALSGSRIDYSIDIREKLFAVEADPGQLAQVIQNIVLNADQAMPMGGMVVITAGNTHAPGPRVPSQLKEGDYVMISIQDRGVGIPEQYLTRIFDPYFTTKEKGSGLGLATSYSIIRNHDGMIDVRSQIGKGSTFTIYLPATGTALQPVPELPTVSRPSRRGKVLVMDDEEVVRMVAGELLDQLGHEAGFASDGEAALVMYRAAKESGRSFDVVILDLTIRGGMGGVETVRKLREIDPDVKAVVTSGYSDNDVVSEYQKYGFLAFLKKPYDLEELHTILDSLLK